MDITVQAGNLWWTASFNAIRKLSPCSFARSPLAIAGRNGKASNPEQEGCLKYVRWARCPIHDVYYGRSCGMLSLSFDSGRPLIETSSDAKWAGRRPCVIWL